MRRLGLKAIQLALIIIATCNFSSGFTTRFIAMSGRKSYAKPKAWCGALSSSVHRGPSKENSVVFMSATNRSHQPTENSSQAEGNLSNGYVKKLRVFRSKLRKRCKSVVFTAMVAVMALRIGGTRPVYASNSASLGGSVVSVSTTSTLPSSVDILTKMPNLKKRKEEKLPSLTLEDFERLRREVPYLPPSSQNDVNPASSSEVPEKPLVALNTVEAVAARNLARSKNIRQSPISSKVNRAAPIVGVGFILLNLFRSKVRYDREKAYVEDNIEKLEIQKAEYFNVTGQSLSDDDLMESLANAAGNITLDGNDYSEDEDDEEEKDLGGTQKRPPPSPKSPPGNSGGEFKKKTSESGVSPSSTENSGRASDDDIERMKRLFKK